MKKLVLLAAIVAGMAGFARAEVRAVPTGPGSNLPSADYGGVDVATVTLSSANAVLFTNGGSIAWVWVTSASAVTDGFTIRSSAPVNLSGGAANRLFLRPSSVSGGVQGNVLVGDYKADNVIATVFASTMSGTLAQGFFWTPPTPIRLPRGGLIKSNNTNLGPIMIGYPGFGK